MFGSFRLAKCPLRDFVAAFAVSWSATVAMAEEQAILIVLRPSVTVSDAQVTLGDVADVHGGSAVLVAQLNSVQLGSAPPAGESMVLTRKQLAAFAGRHWPRQGGSIEWAGASDVVLVRGFQTVQAADLEDAASRALRAWLAEQATRFEVERAPTLLTAVSVPSGRLDISARPQATNQPPVGRVVVWIELRVNDRIVRVLPVAMHVRAFGQQWVAREKLERNQVVTPQHFERREVEFRLPYRAAAVDVPARLRLGRDFQPGQTLEATDVRETHVVSRGDLVIAEIHSGRVSVRATAESLQDGRLGQRVLVKVGGSAKPLFASVIEPGLVEVRR